MYILNIHYTMSSQKENENNDEHYNIQELDNNEDDYYKGINTVYGKYIYFEKTYKKIYFVKYLKDKNNEYVRVNDCIYFNNDDNIIMFEYQYIDENSNIKEDSFLVNEYQHGDDIRFKTYKLEQKINFDIKYNDEFYNTKLVINTVNHLYKEMIKHMENLFIENDILYDILKIFDYIEYLPLEKNTLYLRKPIDYAKWYDNLKSMKIL